MEKEPLIVSDPRIMVGKPVIKGTRITVEFILRKVAAGQTIEQILKDYPHLTQEGIRAALEFAAKSVSLERVYISNQERASA
jgi:uncharacterized protein (DUF433 family)